jgi:hypothetical protein
LVLRSIFVGESTGVPPLFEEVWGSKSRVIGRDSVAFTGSGFQDEFRVCDFADDPILVDFVGVEFAVGGWRDVFGSSTG